MCSGQVIGVVLFSSAFLLLLYFLYDYLFYIMIAMFVLFGSIAMQALLVSIAPDTWHDATTFVVGGWVSFKFVLSLGSLDGWHSHP